MGMNENQPDESGELTRSSSKTEEFLPPPLLKHPTLQTLLGGSKLRKLGKNPMLSAAREVILETDAHVRLLGHYSAHPEAKGVVILLSGWLGDSDSPYMISTGRYLYEHGYSVFRLNYRDHGDSHHLNEGLFYASHLDEVFDCVSQAACSEKGCPAFLAGFSLGGNFALRIARRCATARIENLQHVICVSPLLNPDKSTAAVDRNRLICAYFLKKWRKSLLRKQSLFSTTYNFAGIIKDSIRGTTEELVKQYSIYKDALEYFEGYTVTDDMLRNISVPTTIITAEDDPIIPIEDFHRLELNHLTRLVIHRYGGHNGFIESFRLNSWYERRMVVLFDQLVL